MTENEAPQDETSSQEEGPKDHGTDYGEGPRSPEPGHPAGETEPVGGVPDEAQEHPEDVQAPRPTRTSRTGHSRPAARRIPSTA